MGGEMVQVGVGKSVLTPFNDRAVVSSHIYSENREVRFSFAFVRGEV